MTEAAEARFRVEGMDCASCAAKIDRAVRRLPGVEDVAVSVSAGTMTVRHGPGSDLAALARTVSGLGYQVEPAGGGAPPHAAHADEGMDVDFR